MEKYYKAYDKRYRQVHQKKISWASNNNTKIVYETIKKYEIAKENTILEIGCGEGRDARYLLEKGYNVLATDVSSEAINYCKENNKKMAKNYRVLDVLDSNDFKLKFDFIYSVACIHMLTEEEDRNNYYKFIYDHLNNDGIALILSMGNGKSESKSDSRIAWDDTERIHAETKEKLNVASTSCRIVNFETLFKEIDSNGLKVKKYGITEIIPDFSEIMYVIIEKNNY